MPILRPIDAPFFPYRGGKARLRRSIIRWCKLNGSVYCEPFAGRANLFFLMLRMGEFEKWHLNDIQTIPFFQALLRYDGSPLPELTKEEVAKLHKRNSDLYYWLEPITFWAGGLADKTSPTGHRGHDLGKYAERLQVAKDSLERAELTERDAIQIIREYKDDPEAFLYLDPPYLNAKFSSYNEGMVDRKQLVKTLKKCSCRWLLSERLCPDLIKAFGQPVAQIYNVPVNSSPGSETRWEVECLWSNYEVQPRYMNFKDTERPIAISKYILDQNNPLTFEEWIRLTPKHWRKPTQVAQFKRLQTNPDCYFDGIRIYKVENWNA